MKGRFKALVYRVGQPGVVEDVPNTLEAQQALVGGYIESVHVGGGLYLTCNEEGKLKELPPNFRLPGDIIVGDVFFCRVRGGECVSVTEKDVQKLRSVVGR